MARHAAEAAKISRFGKPVKPEPKPATEAEEEAEVTQLMKSGEPGAQIRVRRLLQKKLLGD